MTIRQVIAVRSVPSNSQNDHDIIAYRYKTYADSAINIPALQPLTFSESYKAEMCNWAQFPGDRVFVLYRTGYVEAKVYYIGNENNLFLKTIPDGIRENNLSALTRF